MQLNMDFKNIGHQLQHTISELSFVVLFVVFCLCVSAEADRFGVINPFCAQFPSQFPNSC